MPRFRSKVPFLQHAGHLDLNESRLAVLGEITKRFVVTPDVDALLNVMDAAESAGPVVEGEENMISMDVTQFRLNDIFVCIYAILFRSQNWIS